MSGSDAGSATSLLCLDDASYVLGSLSPTDRQAFEQHLAGCATCQASVARLAGLPGLLATTSAAELAQEQVPVPPDLLPRLLAVASRERRRRRVVWVSTAAAAAACILALVVVVVVRPATAVVQAHGTPVAMQALHPGPMDVSLQLLDKQWGTSIVVNCHYQGSHDAGEPYQLVVFDEAGRPQPAGRWTSIAGGGLTVTTATSLHVKDISRLEIQLPNGTPVLSAVPKHS